MTASAKSVITQGLLILLVITMLFPLFWMLSISLRSDGGFVTGLADVMPTEITFQNYVDVWNSGSFGRYFFNSVFVAGVVTLGNLLFCTMAGYVFARKRFRFKKTLFVSVLVTLMIPAQVVMVPLYILINELGWFDTYFALIVPWLVNPFGIFLMRQYIESLPRSLEEAAFIDGASDLQILFRVVMPLARPALAVLGIYIFMTNWNLFLYPFLFTDSEAMRTLPVGLAFFQGYQSIDWAHLMAGSAISALPVIVLFMFFQRHIIEGLTQGALKG